MGESKPYRVPSVCELNFLLKIHLRNPKRRKQIHCVSSFLRSVEERGHVQPLFPHLHFAILNEPSEEKTETPKGSQRDSDATAAAAEQHYDIDDYYFLMKIPIFEMTATAFSGEIQRGKWGTTTFHVYFWDLYQWLYFLHVHNNNVAHWLLLLLLLLFLLLHGKLVKVWPTLRSNIE